MNQPDTGPASPAQQGAAGRPRMNAAQADSGLRVISRIVFGVHS